MKFNCPEELLDLLAKAFEKEPDEIIYGKFEFSKGNNWTTQKPAMSGSIVTSEGKHITKFF